MRIYLDQNKWIDLSRARHGHRLGTKYIHILSKLTDAVEAGKVTLPLSATHIMETHGDPDVSRRKRLADVLVDLSKGRTLASMDYLLGPEVNRAVSRHFGLIYTGEDPSPLGLGIPFAFGISDDVLAQQLRTSRDRAQLVNAFTHAPEVLKSFLIGTASMAVVQTLRRKRERWASGLDQDRLKLKGYDLTTHRRAYAAILMFHMQGLFERATQLLGLSMADLVRNSSPQQLMRLFEDIPTADVEIKVHTMRDRQWHRSVDPNDMQDVGFLNVAVPYCDVVVTEKFWVHLVKRCHLHSKYDTAMCTDLTELADFL